MNILFVCTGNINRSPAAEIIYHTLSPRDNVDSAALSNKKSILTTKAMRLALEKSGYNYYDIRSKPVTQKLVDWADIVFYMSPIHLKQLNEFGKSNKYVNLGHLIGKKGIHDPHFDKTHDSAVKDIERALKIFIMNKKIVPLISTRSLFL